MIQEKRLMKATWQIMEQLLEVDRIDEALSGSLDIIVNTLESEAGAIWILDENTNRLIPMFHIGPADISGVSVENGIGIEGVVTGTGKSMIVSDARLLPFSSDTRQNSPAFGATPFPMDLCQVCMDSSYR